MSKFVIEKVFTYHAPQHDQLARYQELRDAGKALAYMIDRMAPDSREKSLALTKLQETIMFANAAIAINEQRA